MSNIVGYFVTRSVKDYLPAGDFKSINKSAENLFRCGHVQAIHTTVSYNMLFVKSKCLPEMRKDRVYHVRMAINNNSYDIVNAECGCPAGCGPCGSCKHIGALSYALADFFRCKASPELLTCTDQLQQWNRPRGRKIDPIPVDQIGIRRRELLPSKVRSKGSGMIYDPRPLHLREVDPQAIEKLRCDLLKTSQPCGFLNVLIPTKEKIDHDHSYYSKSTYVPSVPNTCDECDPRELLTVVEKKLITPENILENLSLGPKERLELEEQTKDQSSSSLWFSARQNRITGSKCGRILIQQRKTTPLLQSVIYPKPMLHVPKTIEWGRSNEKKACESYKKYMESNGHSDLRTIKAGFVVHPEKGWLGASPDAYVFDPSVDDPTGIAEFKCPFTMADKVHLKRTHQYYHQVQLQLYVTCLESKWCDFCVYSPKGVCVERIYPDKQWQAECCLQLDNSFFEHILPELMEPCCKPSYYL